MLRLDLRASSEICDAVAAYDVLFAHAFLIKERRGATFGANTVQIRIHGGRL